MTSKNWGLRSSGVIGLVLLLAACSTLIDSSAPTATRAAPVTSGPPATVQPSPAVLPPTQPPALPTSTIAPTEAAMTSTTVVSATSSCRAPAALTPAQTEGPYYKPHSPERASLLEPGMNGTKLIVTGHVLTKDCQPVAKAWLDFWQADDKGAYDNAGYKLRGHLFTDETGRYMLETIVPGEYPGRTQHIHAKVQAPNGPILTTQIYFPNEPGNARDAIFDPALLAQVQNTVEGKLATFDFVVPTP